MHPSEHEFKGMDGEHVQRLADHAERRGHQFCPRIVIEDDHREVVRDADPLLDKPSDRTLHLGGVGHDEGRGRLRHGKEGADGIAAGVPAERYIADQQGVNREGRVVVRRGVAANPGPGPLTCSAAR